MLDPSPQQQQREQLSAQFVYDFKAVKPKQISAKRGEKVKIVNVRDGNATVTKENGVNGEVPTYFLELDHVPGETFAEQIDYRRNWYETVDGRNSADSTSTLMCTIDNSIDLMPLLSVNTDSSSYSSSLKKLHPQSAPVCIEELCDVTIKVNSTLTLSCAFHSNHPYTLIWRGPAISRKADFKIKIEENGESILTVPKCTSSDGGQYWVQATNDYGTSHTVAWITVVDVPHVPISIRYTTVEESGGVELKWQQPIKGNTKYVWYIVEYKCDEDSSSSCSAFCEASSNDYDIAADGLMHCSVLISDLKPKQYSFRVRAFNELFKGQPSHSLNFKPSIEMIRYAARNAFLKEYNTKVEYLDEKFFEYYTVGDVIGRGRFSLVKKAVCNTSNRRFAAKFLTRHPVSGVDLDEDHISKEIQTLNALRHSNIVSLHAAVKTTHDFVIVMKWINGPSILKYIAKLGYFNEEFVRNLIRDAFAALDYMHSFSMAHYDLKPEDLLVHLSKHSARLVLIDFGYSQYCCQSSAIPLSYQMNEFSSPEQYLHRSPTTKSDIWSIGVILFVLLCGELPFDSSNNELMRLSIISANLRIDSAKRFHLFSDSLKSFVKSILVLNIHERPTASDCLKSEWITQKVSCEEIQLDDR
ncbi:unnamed protein product [Anisakis simplex]|uniref:Protein kinase domain-containing protein n=1 Tax=Anisakis simplex TaxID=6269 RepID=A0A0M3JR17_ANISI|nr:unnamed protein product [Anisakis simplex]